MREHRTRLGLLRTRWSAVGAAVAVTLGAGGLSMAQAAIDTGDRPVTVSIAAERILDTRVNLGLAGRFADATPRDIQVTGSVPVASGGNKTVVPADAIGVLVNVTVVTPTHEGFLSLRPSGAPGEPTTSTVNFFPGGDRAQRGNGRPEQWQDPDLGRDLIRLRQRRRPHRRRRLHHRPHPRRPLLHRGRSRRRSRTQSQLRRRLHQVPGLHQGPDRREASRR